MAVAGIQGQPRHFGVFDPHQGDAARREKAIVQDHVHAQVRSRVEGIYGQSRFMVPCVAICRRACWLVRLLDRLENVFA